MSNSIENASNYSAKKYRTPDGVPADIAIFTITSEEQNSSAKSLPKRELKVLLVKRKNWPYAGSWALPGGFSNENETLLDAAKRELKEETNIDGVYIKQLGVYSSPGRDPRGWIISSAYYALVNEKYLEKRKAADDAADVQLFTVSEVLQMKKGSQDGEFNKNEETLAFDHNEIISDAYEIIKSEMRSTLIAKEFLPEEFTIAEYMQIVKTVLPDYNEERPNFARKLTSTKSRDGLIKKVIIDNKEKTTTRHSQRPTQLYRFTGKKLETSYL